MDFYNQFDSLSEGDIQRIVQQIKAHRSSPGSRWVGLNVEQAIDNLAAEYNRKIQQMYTDVIINRSAGSDSFGGFVDYLARLHGIHRVYRQDVELIPGAGQLSLGSMAWNALVHQTIDSRILNWLEEWIFTSLSCILHCMEHSAPFLEQLSSSIDRDVAARLQRFFGATGVAVIGFGKPAQVHPHQPGEGDGDADYELGYEQSWRNEFFAHVASDSHRFYQFINDLARGCQLLIDTHVFAYTNRAIVDAVGRIVNAGVQRQAAKWDSPCLDRLLEQVRLVVATLDALLYPNAGLGTPKAAVATVNARPLFHSLAESQLYNMFCDLRASELFSIIIDYPESSLAISDLNACVAKLGNLQQTAHSLRNAIKQRLLHPGATTSDILTQYISAIRCLRLLDPSNTILEIVARPIRAYLRSRDDTVSCIVQDMVSEESELFEDLASGHGVIMDNGPDGVIYDEEYSDRNWEPLPVEAKNVYLTAQRRDADVLSLLVSIYDTKDVFVQEFERHLAQQLLACSDYNAEREIKQVEMMKLRFGDQALEKCEVMLKDMAESKRTDQLISEASLAKRWDVPLHALIVSRLFWSSAPKEQFAMPGEMAEARDKYADIYESLKPARKLEWRDALGLVTLKIELADRTVNVSAKPAQVAVLYAFQDSLALTLAELAQKLECSEEFALSRVRFWQSRGVLRETDANVFEVAETKHGSSHNVVQGGIGRGTAGSQHTLAAAAAGPSNVNTAGGHASDGDDDDDDIGSNGGRAGMSHESTDALRVHYQFIGGILKNLGPLPLDRILNMLGMFLPGETITAEELRTFLALMVREDKLEVAGGLYRLV